MRMVSKERHSPGEAGLYKLRDGIRADAPRTSAQAGKIDGAALVEELELEFAVGRQLLQRERAVRLSARR